MSGVDLLGELHRRDPGLPVVLITAYATVESAVEAMRRGAFDYLSKPFSREALKVSVHRALRVRRLENENTRLRAERDDSPAASSGESPAMQSVLQTLERAAQLDATVLVTARAAPARSWSRARSTTRARARERPFVRGQLRARSPRRCSRASCSATCAARSPAPSATARAASSWPTAAPSSSTRSARSRPPCR